MIIWINGTFGVGKTTTATSLAETASGLRIFDPEHVGYMVQANLRDREFSDFQELPPWRQLVPQVLHRITGFTGSHLIAPQSVLVMDYWTELRRGMDDHGLEVVHVVLDCDERQLQTRIEHDEVERDAKQWRLDHLSTYREARDWLVDAADLVIDTSDMTPPAIVDTILEDVSDRGLLRELPSGEEDSSESLTVDSVADPNGTVAVRSPYRPAFNQLAQPVGVSVDMTKPEQPPTTPMEGRFCRLIALNVEDHGDDLHSAFRDAADDEDWTYLPYGPFEHLDDFRSWLGTVENRNDPMFFAIVDNETQAAVGVASYLRLDRYAASIEVGHIHFSRKLQRTPAATEAMFLLMKRVFDAGYRRYEWKCDDHNGPSRAAAARLGFRYEGTFRQATRYKGRNRDTAWYSIIDQEWPAIEAEYKRWLHPDNFDGSLNQVSRLSTRS